MTVEREKETMEERKTFFQLFEQVPVFLFCTSTRQFYSQP